VDARIFEHLPLEKTKFRAQRAAALEKGATHDTMLALT